MVSANDVSRVFLQSMISRRVVTDKLARVLWAKAVDAVKSNKKPRLFHLRNIDEKT